MDKNRKKELVEQFKQTEKYMGVYQIKNKLDGKILIGSFPNLKNKWSNMKVQLDMNTHFNPLLQKAWNESGEENFEYEVLEQVEVTDKISDVKFELAKLEDQWLEKLQPYDECGYNRRKK